MTKMMLKIGVLIAAAALAGIGAGGCVEDEMLAPPMDCQENHKATVRFKNDSAGATYDVVMDGYRVGTIGPGNTETTTAAAGGHTFTFYFAGTNNVACSTATPNLAQCDSYVFSCDTEP